MNGSENLLQQTIDLPNKFWKWYIKHRYHYIKKHPTSPDEELLKLAYSDWSSNQS